MALTTSSSASLFSGTSDDLIAEATNLSTPASLLPVSPADPAQLTTDPTPPLNTDAPQNVTQNNINNSTLSQNMTVGSQESQAGYPTAANYTKGNETVHEEKTTTGGLNHSEPLSERVRQLQDVTTGFYNENTSPLSVETLSEAKNGNLQNTTGRTNETSQRDNSTEGHWIHSPVTPELETNKSVNITDTANPTEKNSLDSFKSASNYSSTNSDSLESNTKPSTFARPSTLSNTVANSTSSQSASDDRTSSDVPFNTDSATTAGSEVITSNGTKMEKNLVGISTTNATTWTDVPLEEGTVMSENPGSGNSNATVIAVGVVAGLLFVAALIIVYLLARKRVLQR